MHAYLQYVGFLNCLNSGNLSLTPIWPEAFSFSLIRNVLLQPGKKAIWKKPAVAYIYLGVNGVVK